MLKGTFKNNILIIAMMVIFLIDFFLIYTTHQNWQVSMKKYMPLKSQIQVLKSDLILTHLLFEQASETSKLDNLKIEIINKLKHEEFKSFFNKSKKVLQNNDLAFYTQIKDIDSRLDSFLISTKNKFIEIDTYTENLNFKKYDKELNNLITLIDNLYSQIDYKLDYELNRKTDYFHLIIFIFIFTNVLVIYFLFYYKKQRDLFEKNLYEEKEKAVVTLHSIGDAVITTDKDGYVVYLNPVAQNLTGYSLEDAVGKYLDDVFYIANETTKQKIKSPLSKVLETGVIQTLTDDILLISKDGTNYFIEDSAAPIKDKSGEILGVVLVFHDITKQRHYRKKLNENERLLVQQSKMAAMGEMLENIAHQWRQPLSVISTTVSGLRLKKQLGELEDDFLVESLLLVQNSTQYLSKTIDDFREFFMPNKEKEKFNISNIYEKSYLLVSTKLKEERINIISSIEGSEFLGFENELVQVLINLLNNSIDAFDKQMEKKFLFVDIYKEKYFLYIKVLDNAGGIKPTILNRVFEPYFTTKHKSVGTGIGLYMVEEIITKHMNGEIVVNNKEFTHEGNKYVGAEFIISLPI